MTLKVEESQERTLRHQAFDFGKLAMWKSLSLISDLYLKSCVEAQYAPMKEWLSHPGSKGYYSLVESLVWLQQGKQRLKQSYGTEVWGIIGNSTAQPMYPEERTAAKEVPLSSEEQALHDELMNLMHQESLAKAHNDDQELLLKREIRWEAISIAKGKEHVNSTFTLSTANIPPQSTGNTPTDSDDDTPKDGVFSTNSFDAEEGGVADYNNMDPTIDVPSTPTLRIHKIHPQSQIYWQKQEEGGDYDEVLHQWLELGFQSLQRFLIDVVKWIFSVLCWDYQDRRINVREDVVFARSTSFLQARNTIVAISSSEEEDVAAERCCAELIYSPTALDFGKDLTFGGNIWMIEPIAIFEDASQTSGGDEGLLDIYALNREVKRLKKQTLSQAKQILKLKAKLKKLSKFVQPVVKHHAFWVERQNLKKQKRRRKKQKKKVSSVKIGRNKEEGTLSEEHNVQEEDTAHPFFDDIIDKD
ncbi:hypothetical protein Tco_0509149, partial [Tanacetum coccineum]